VYIYIYIYTPFVLNIYTYTYLFMFKTNGVALTNGKVSDVSEKINKRRLRNDNEDSCTLDNRHKKKM